MTLISAISNLGSVKSSSSLKQINSTKSNLSFNGNQTANSPHEHDNGTHLVNLGILANVLGIIGLGVNAKVL